MKILKKNGELIILFTVMGLACMAMAILQPVMPLYLTSIGISPSLIGLMLAVGMVGMVFGESSGGWLADKVGLKIPLGIGTFLCAPLVLALLPARGTQNIFLIFLVWGIVRSAIFGPGRGYIGNRASAANKATLIAVYMTTQSVSRSLGTLVSGFIADNLGYRWDFYFAAGISVVAGLLLAFGLRNINWWKPPAKTASSGSSAIPSPVKQPVNYRFFIIQCVIVVFYLLGPGINSFLPLLATEVVGMDATQVGILFTIGGVVNTIMLIPMGKLADKVDKRLLMIIGALLCAVTFFGIGCSRSFAMLALFTVISGISFATYTPAAVALLSNTTPLYWQNTAMGIYGGAEDAGIIIGQSAAGFIWSAWSPAAAYFLGGAAGILAAVTCAVFLRGKSYRQHMTG